MVNVSSVAGEVPLAYQASYAAVKAGITSLGRSLNEELRLAGLHETLKVGTILPWAADTPWWDHVGNYTGHAPRLAAMDRAAAMKGAGPQHITTRSAMSARPATTPATMTN